jgi:hypothetical protein
MSRPSTLMNLGLSASLSLLALGCGAPAADAPVSARADALIINATAHLTWANDWLAAAKANPSSVTENVYGTQPSYITMGNGVLTNRTVCSSLVVQLMRNAHGLTDADFRNSFPRRTDQGKCEVGSTKYNDGSEYQGQAYGTTGPNTAQFNYKIENCSDVGPIRFEKISAVTSIQPGDIMAMRYVNPTPSASGHNMIVRSAPTTAPVHPVTLQPVTLPAGPAGSIAYAVEIVDSTSGNHGNGTVLPDTRPGAVNNTGGVGTGYFILYADSVTQAIVASRWSVNSADLDLVSTHPITVGRLKTQ